MSALRQLRTMRSITSAWIAAPREVVKNDPDGRLAGINKSNLCARLPTACHSCEGGATNDDRACARRRKPFDRDSGQIGGRRKIVCCSIRFQRLDADHLVSP